MDRSLTVAARFRVTQHVTGELETALVAGSFASMYFDGRAVSVCQAIADLVVVLHALYVSFVVLVVPAILLGEWRGWRFARNFAFRVVHVLMIAFVACESLIGTVCPLTDWENHLREAAGQSAQQGSFIGRWAHRLIFVDLSPEVLTLAYVLFAAVVIVMFIAIPPRRPRFFSRG